MPSSTNPGLGETPQADPAVTPSAGQTPTPEAKKPSPMMKWGLIGVAAALVIGGAVWGAMTWLNPKSGDDSAKKGEKTKLVYAVHWTEDHQLKAFQKYLDEYTALHSDIEFSVQVIKYGDYANKLKVLYDAGSAPDIYQIYSPWGVSYARQGMLDTPPADIQKDVKDNYVSQSGVTIDGKIWGIPTEVNDYAMLYNKDLFKAAGLVDSKGNAVYPKTWAEFVSTAAKLTKKDAKGNITQYGVAFLKDNDWQVVDPFLSLLFSNGGEYLSADLKKSMFNSAAGVAALNAELELFKNGSTDLNSNFFDFKDGKVGMVLSPPWPKGSFAQSYGDKFATSVGVAPFPKLKNQSSLQYSWFMGVMSSSKHKQAAWDFLKWFSTDVQASGTTRYGDLMADPIGAIPSRKIDIEKHQDVLGDFFTKTFVEQLPNSKAEPNVADAGTIKSTLMTEIQAAWAGQKTAAEALNAAAAAVDKTLNP